MSRFTIICKILNRKTKRYNIDQKIELNDYKQAMEMLDKLEDQYYRESMNLYTIDFKDHNPFAPR
jgi:predicted ATPase